jgi:hypothetical protein
MRTRTEEKVAQERPKRTRMGRRNVLTVSGITDQDEFHYRWFLDINDRISQAQEAGYVLVHKGGLSAGDRNIESARGDDSVLQKPAGNGRNMLFLMKIPIEFYKEDQAAKQNDILSLEADLFKSKPELGQYGHSEVSVKSTA